MDHDRRDRDERREPLDPLRQPQRWEALVSSIVGAAAPELARRRVRVGVEGVLLQWARPALATAATVALLVTAAALLGDRERAADDGVTSLAGAVVPESYAAWLVADYEPTVTELVVALEEVGR